MGLCFGIMNTGLDGYNPNDEASRQKFQADVAEGIRRGTMATWTADQHNEYNRQNFRAAWHYFVFMFWFVVVGIPVWNWLDNHPSLEAIAGSLFCILLILAAIGGVMYTTFSGLSRASHTLGLGGRRRR